MARPAGYSSDEEFSDDGMSLSHSEIRTVRNYRSWEDDAEKHKDLMGEKLINAVIEGNINDLNEIVNEVNLNYKSKKFGDWTALMHACSQGNAKIVEILLKSGANPRDHFQLQTPIHCVCNSKNQDEMVLLQCLNLLLEHGAALNARDWFGIDPLSYAVKMNREKLVLKFISLGCEVDNEDSDGWSPIFYAVDGGHINLVQILKDAGASIRRIDNKGRTLHDIASAKFYKDIAEMVNCSDKTIEIDDILDKFRDYRRASNYEYILSELPDKTKGRFHGFPSDAARWIHGIGLDTLVKLFMVNEIQLGQILTMNDNQLKDLGVEFSYDRTKIRYCVQNFHQHSWGKNCLRELKGPIDLHTTAQVICNTIRQLHLVSLATFFWRKHNGHELCHSKKDCINKGLYYTRFLRKEVNAILAIALEIEQEDDIKPCDLILPRNNEVMPWFSKKVVFVTVVLLAAVYKAGRYLYPLVGFSEITFPRKLVKFV